MNATPLSAPRLSALFATGFVSVRLNLSQVVVLWLWLLMFLPGSMAATDTSAAKASVIPLEQIGATIERQYSGDGLSVRATNGGARLRCAFQKIEGEVTREGLWLSSTAGESNRFRVLATSVGRATPNPQSIFDLRFAIGERRATNGKSKIENLRSKIPQPPVLRRPGEGGSTLNSQLVLACTGTVEVAGNVARFIRPGLTEEYRVSVDGVQQDFVIAQRPGGQGQLRVELEVAGARAEPLENGVRLVLEGSGRKLNYDRLRVTDGTGRQLPARIEVLPVGDEVTSLKSLPENREVSLLTSAPTSSVGDEVTSLKSLRENQEVSLLTSAPTLAVLVDDTEAVYPVQIDPTFSDADWFSLGGIPGANGIVLACVVDGSGNLYIGGDFTAVGEVVANYIAKWNGSSWSALGSGMNDDVWALAVSGTDLYAGGDFTTAGGKVSAYAARAYIGGVPGPALSIFRSGANVTLSWPSVGTAGFLLEQTPTVAIPASWTTNTAPVTEGTTNKSVTIRATNSQQYFRLRKP